MSLNYAGLSNFILRFCYLTCRILYNTLCLYGDSKIYLCYITIFLFFLSTSVVVTVYFDIFKA